MLARAVGQSQRFAIYSQPGAGTAVVARVTADGRADAPTAIGSVCVAKPGEDVAGGSWTSIRDDATVVVLR